MATSLPGVGRPERRLVLGGQGWGAPPASAAGLASTYWPTSPSPFHVSPGSSFLQPGVKMQKRVLKAASQVALPLQADLSVTWNVPPRGATLLRARV